MKVKELIKILEQLPPDARVFVWSSDGFKNEQQVDKVTPIGCNQFEQVIE